MLRECWSRLLDLFWLLCGKPYIGVWKEVTPTHQVGVVFHRWHAHAFSASFIARTCYAAIVNLKRWPDDQEIGDTMLADAKADGAAVDAAPLIYVAFEGPTVALHTLREDIITALEGIQRCAAACALEE